MRMPGIFRTFAPGLSFLMMMYSEKQMEYSELILSTLFNNGGRMKESDVCDVLDEKYGEETIEPALQIESLIVPEGMIVRDGTYPFLTAKGRQAAEAGFAKFLQHPEGNGILKKFVWEIIIGVFASLIASLLIWLLS